MEKKYQVAIKDLRNICDPSVFNFKDTSEVEPLDRVIDQKRAVKAIQFGLKMKSPGYNIFLTGLDGTGKTTIIKDLVTDYASSLPIPDEWCMVNNFKDEFKPKAIRMPAKTAFVFSKKLTKQLKDLQTVLNETFENERYQEQLEAINTKHKEKQKKLFQDVDAFARQKNIQLQQTKTGFQTLPFFNDSVLSPKEFDKLPEKQKQTITDDLDLVQEQLKLALREINKSNASLLDDVEELKTKVALTAVEDQLATLRHRYRDRSTIVSYLNDVQEDILDDINGFLGEDTPLEAIQDPLMKPGSPFDSFRVNILVDRRFEQGAPIIFEPNPTYQNLFGQIEKRAFMGGISTDFTMIQAGSLLRANGGFLIMDMESILTNNHVWDSLKRALLNQRIAIEDFPLHSGMGVSSMRPEPIPLDVKIILIGSYHLFEKLQNFDSKFNKIFKVRADFDYETQKSEANVQLYARFIARVCLEENLLPFTPEGVSTIIEYGEKVISDQSKLSLRFGNIMGVLKESDYWARQEKSETITRHHVLKTCDEQNFRHSLYEEKIHESYADNTLMIDVDGDVIGQVNGLAVYQIGETAFGRPSRITAETYMGKPGIINVEREADLSGSTHNKGVMIISGYLGRTFAREYPLTLSISIAFEQSYSGVDGDSASSTELYAILSSLSGIGIHQGLAVTGSVNQKGFIQAIGGANEKIEGFFDVCRSKGLTGNQGVVIPAANVKNLMLRHDVIEAVEKGVFHIYQVSTIAQGMEILTGVPAGIPDANGHYPEKTVFGNVQKQLKMYFDLSLKYKTSHTDLPGWPETLSRM